MKKLAILAVVMVLMGLPSWAAATSVTYTDSISSALTDWTSSLVFPKFNSALGTLTQIELYLYTGANGLDTKFDVSAATATDGHARTEVTITVTDPSNLISDASIDKLFPASGSPPGYHFVIPSGGGTASSGIYYSSGTNDTFYTDGGILSEFTGSGNISLAAGTFTQTTATWSGGTPDVKQTTHADLNGTITYEYTAGPPVPVPPSALLLGSGLVGLLALRRRQKASKR